MAKLCGDLANTENQLLKPGVQFTEFTIGNWLLFKVFRMKNNSNFC